MRFFQYLKPAFLLRLNVPGLGSIPVNLIALLGFLMLGFGSPGFWLLGLGLEIAYLYGFASNRRFQRWIDSRYALRSEEDFALQWRELVARLPQAEQQRLTKLERSCDQAVQKYRESQTSGYIADTNQDALRKLAWIYLKLLIAKINLQSLDGQSNEADLERRIAALEKELLNESLPLTVKESKQATLEILMKRKENLGRRESSLQEIESDLSRIEAQVDLALESATMQDQPQAISSNIDLFSHVLEERPFGDSEQTIARLEESLRQKN